MAKRSGKNLNEGIPKLINVILVENKKAAKVQKNAND